MGTQIEGGEWLPVLPPIDGELLGAMPLLGVAQVPGVATMIIGNGRPLAPRYPYFLSLILPAHNEEGNIEAVTWEALAILPELFHECEIVIVDDGSTDATPRLIDRLADLDQRVRTIHHPQNCGYGSALRSGFAAARGDRILFMDADRQFDIREVAKFASLTERYDIVAGYRLRRNDPWQRVALGAAFNTVVKLLFGVWVRDIDCGFKLFHADLLGSLHLQAPGALLNTEILALAHRQGATLAEVGVTHHPRSAGAQSGGSPRVILRSLGEMLALWGRLRASNATPDQPEPRTLRTEIGE